MHVDLQKRFPKNHVSQMLGGPSLRLGESPNLFVFQSFVSEFCNLIRDFCHGRQRVAPFYHDSLTTTTDRTTGLLLQSDRLVFSTR